MDVDDENYFNPSIYFICKLCQHSFTSVTQLLSHKRLQHTKHELKGIKCIIFEESFVETIVESPFKSILQKSDSINWDKTAKSSLKVHLGKNSSKINTGSISSKSGLGILPNPYVRLTLLTPSEIDSYLKTGNRRSCTEKSVSSLKEARLQESHSRRVQLQKKISSVNGNDIFAQEQNVYNENETPSGNTLSNNTSLESESLSSASSERNLVLPQSHTIFNSGYSPSDSDAQDPNDREYIVASIFKNSDGIENIQFESIRVPPTPTNKSAEVTATSTTILSDCNDPAEREPEPVDACLNANADDYCRRENKDDEASSPLEKWIKNQKQIRYSDGRQNFILFSQDSASASSASLKISKESPVTCKLCATKQVTEAEFRNHCENCYLHNQDRHIYCISCSKNFKNPQLLNFHLLDVHLTSENLPGLGKPGAEGPTGPEPEPAPEIKNQYSPNNADDLPIAEWLSNRNKNFPDFIMLDPDPTQPEFHVGAGIILKWLTCKLCSAKLESEAEVKKHVAGCWPYNKLNHSFCVRCKTAGWESEDLLKHRRNAHLRKSLVLSLPFFCIECNLEFQTHDELDLHENSLQQFWKNMLAGLDSDWELFKSTITSSSYPSQDSLSSGADSDSSNSAIYLAENIFDDKPEIHRANQFRLRIRPTKRKRISMNSRQESGSSNNGRKRMPLPFPRKQNIDATTEVKTPTTSLADWLNLQKYRKYPDGSVNVIVLHPNPASALYSKPMKISPNNPVTCRLCQTNLETEADAKNHAENCWLHNKDRHILCIKCKKTFKNPIQLQNHNSRKTCNSVDPAKEDMVNALEMDKKNLDLDLLPLGEWIQNRKQIFPDIILVDPDPTSDSYLKSVNSAAAKKPACSSASSVPLMCTLCRFKCQSEKLMKCHVQICWPYNKKNHVYCVPCSRAFRSPKELESHERVSMFHPFKPKPLPSVFCRDCHQEFNSLRNLEAHQDSAQEFFRKMKQIQAVMNVQRYKMPALPMLPRSRSLSSTSASRVAYTSNSNSNEFEPHVRVTSSDQSFTSDDDGIESLRRKRSTLSSGGVTYAENRSENCQSDQNNVEMDGLTEVPVEMELQEFECEDKNLLDRDQDALLAVTQEDPCQEKHCTPELSFTPAKTKRGAEFYRHNGEEYVVKSRYKNGSVQYKCRKTYCPHRILWFPDSTIVTKGKHDHRVLPTNTATSTSPESHQSTSVPVQKLSHEINTGDSYLSKLRQNEAAKAQQKLKSVAQKNVTDPSSFDDDLLPLGEWVQIQNEKNPQQLIILEPDPTGPDFVVVSEKYQIKCGLCHWTFTSAVHVRHHAKLCWSENKDRHVYCAICDTNYETPLILQRHIRTQHFSSLVNPPMTVTPATKSKYHQRWQYYNSQATRSPPPAILKGGKTQ